jgi:hypothetical protein
MSTPEDPFSRLSRLARRAPAQPPGDLPPGVATRVLAQVRAAREPEGASRWERLSFGALPFATAAAALCLVASHMKQEPPRTDTETLVQHFLTTNSEP